MQLHTKHVKRCDISGFPHSFFSVYYYLKKNTYVAINFPTTAMTVMNLKQKDKFE